MTSISNLLADSDSEDDDPKKHKNLLKSINSIPTGAPPRKKFKKLQSEIYEVSKKNIL